MTCRNTALAAALLVVTAPLAAQDTSPPAPTAEVETRAGSDTQAPSFPTEVAPS